MKQRARELREHGWSYRKIGRELGKGATTIQRWLNTEVAERQRQREYQRSYREAHREEIAEQRRVWYQSHKEESAKRAQIWYQDNREKVAEQQREYRETHKEEAAEYQRHRTSTDPNFKLRNNLRTRLRMALKGNFKTGSAVRDLGCTIPELRTHLEAQFKPGMTWENHGEWHIDHIKPLAKFDLTDRDQLLEAVHYTNLQPLWAEENLQKGCR